MRNIESITEIWPDYLNADAILKALEYHSCRYFEAENVIKLTFLSPKQTLFLTPGELTRMDEPSFLTPHQMALTRTTKGDVVAALTDEFGKGIRLYVDPNYKL